MSSTNPLNNNDLLVYHVADRLQQNTPDSAVIQEIHEEKRKLQVMVKIFGRKTPLELNYMQVDKV